MNNKVGKNYIIPLIIPLILTIVSIKISSIREQFKKLLNIQVNNKLFSLEFVFIFILWFLIFQTFVFPAIPYSKYFGKITSLDFTSLPLIWYKFFIFGLIPIFILNFLSSKTNLISNYGEVVKIPLLIAIFFVTISILQAIDVSDVIIAIIFYILLYISGILKKLESKFDNKHNISLNILIFITLLIIVATTFKYIPKYNSFQNKLDEKLGFSKFSSFKNNFGLYLLLPLLFGYVSEKVFKQNFQLGWILGIMSSLVIDRN